MCDNGGFYLCNGEWVEYTPADVQEALDYVEQRRVRLEVESAVHQVHAVFLLGAAALYRTAPHSANAGWLLINYQLYTGALVLPAPNVERITAG